MIDLNELRRLAQAATPGPWHATKSVETNSWAVWSDTTRLMELRPTKTVDMYRVSNTAAFIAAANPAAITELLDRLEAAESARRDDYQNWMTALDRNAELLSKLDAAEKAINEAYQRGYETGQEEIEKERDALRAKIEAMEKQEPVAWWGRGPRDGRLEFSVDKPVPSVMRDFNMSPIYALPGAQPAPSVPDEVMRDALRYRFLRSARNIPISTKAARDPVVYDEAIDAAMLAAAPEVKP